MNTAPIDDYEGAAEIFTFGAGSFGMWLFLALTAVAFVALIVRAIQHERRCYAELEAGVAPAALAPHVGQPVGDPDETMVPA